MSDSVNPAVWNVEGKKNAAGPKYAVNFRKSTILQLWRFQMMQHEDGEHGGECAIGERQRRSVALDYADVRMIGARAKLQRT